MSEQSDYTGEVINVWSTGWTLVRSDDGASEILIRHENIEGRHMIGTRGSVQFRDGDVHFSPDPNTP